MRSTGAGHLKTKAFRFDGETKRIAVVATVCPTCGKARVTAMGVDKVLNFASGETKHRKVFVMKLVKPAPPQQPPKPPGIPQGSGIAPAIDVPTTVTVERVSGSPRIEGVGWNG